MYLHFPLIPAFSLWRKSKSNRACIDVYAPMGSLDQAFSSG
jgi:hypothetical protein